MAVILDDLLHLNGNSTSRNVVKRTLFNSYQNDYSGQDKVTH